MYRERPRVPPELFRGAFWGLIITFVFIAIVIAIVEWIYD
jgi:hypothetical protein